MTIQDMITEVELLGGGEIIEDRSLLLSLANRALRELYSSIPITRTVVFNARGRRPAVYYNEILCNAGNRINIPLVGKAYSMRLCGKGYYSIVDGDSTKVIQFDTGLDTTVVRGFISEGGTVSFWGSFTFVVYDFSLYDEIYSSSPDSIPDGKATSTYDIREIYSDFLAFISPPRDRYGKTIDQARLHDGILEIDSSFSGEIILTYRRMPTEIYGAVVENDAVEVIDLLEEYKYMFIYLFWYHYWYNTDEAKAKIYKDRFDELRLKDEGYRRSIDSAYVDVNGWA